MNDVTKKNPIVADMNQVAVISVSVHKKMGILKNNLLLKNALGIDIVQIPEYQSERLKNAPAIIAWGRKKSYHNAKKIADKFDKKIITLEDGFLRSLDSGIDSRYGASFIVDDIGVYFDMRYANRLENLILANTIHWHNDKQKNAERLITKIIKNQLSKYNATLFAPNLSELANNNKPHLIIIDQVANDASIVGAGADKSQFLAMLATAKKQFPNHNLWIKAHPAGLGYFTVNDVDNPLFYIDKSCNAIGLLAQADTIFTVSSHLGFEGLMLGKSVHCFGVAWYAGYGLTVDDNAPQSLLNTVLDRRADYTKFNFKSTTYQATLAQLFHSAYLDYSVYADPASCGVTNSPCDIDTVINYLITNRNFALRLTGDVQAVNFSYWKYGFVRQFFATPFNHLQFLPKSALKSLIIKPFLKNPQKRLVWGKSAFDKATGAKFCVEDGFIRSKGLGASLVAPLSLVCDSLGIYYNPKTASDLENLLKTIDLDDEQTAQADFLTDFLIRQNISKYNVGNSLNFNEIIPKNRTVRLVVGQVEDDASILNCLSPIVKNSELLARVRADFPSDFIIYKPHPDVEAGLRIGKVDDALQFADFVASDVSIGDCLSACDVLHTISSQSGFEALLRGKRVVCYGLPFYAGFGLTLDVKNNNPLYINALQRRQRQTPLTANALIYATLIAYPLYRLPNGYGLAQAWQVAEHLATVAPADERSFTVRFKQGLMRLRLWFIRR